MAEFNFQDADGKPFKIQAPDLDTAVAAFKKVAGERAVKPFDYTNRKSGIFPLATDEKGDWQFDITAGLPAGLVDMVKSGVTAPGDAMSGKLTPDDPDYLKRIWDTGALMTGINPGVIAGERAIPGALGRPRKPSAPVVPTADELKAAAGAGFRKAEEMGVDYPTQSVKDMVDDLTRQVESKGIREKRAPDTFSVLNEVKSGPDQSVVSLVGLREIRSALNDIAGDFGPTTKKTDRKAAQDAIRALDQFMEEPPSAGAMAGTYLGDGGTALARATPESFTEAVGRLRTARERAKEAGATVKEANANYAAAERSNTVTGKIKKAELSAEAANSGLNLDNRTRRVLLAIIDPERPRNRRGYSKEELALIDDIVNGKHGADAARWLANFLGGGGGLGALSAGSVGAAAGGGLGALLGGPTGAAIGAPLGGAIPVVAGRVAKGVANRITAKQAARLDELIRKRSPLYQQRVANPGMYAPYPATQDIINRALLLSGPEMLRDEAERFRMNVREGLMSPRAFNRGPMSGN
jgi:hypothetical protein